MIDEYGAVGGMRSAKGKRNLYMALQPLDGPWPDFQFIDLF
jgi:hypothetical protein